MTIHDTHPFAASGQPRRPLRRFRGRLPAPVTIWATYTPRGPVGLTVSSVAVADGEPGEVVGLVDPASDLFDAVLAALFSRLQKACCVIVIGPSPASTGFEVVVN